MTILTPVKPLGVPLLTAAFWAGRHLTFALRKLETLSFIHFAHWAIVAGFPDGRAGERLHHPYLYFESIFNGTWNDYIDAFCAVVPKGINVIWGRTYNFPGATPIVPFEAHMLRNQLGADHFWSAYPHASVTEVAASARVACALNALKVQAELLTPEEFADAYAAFLTHVQADI